MGHSLAGEGGGGGGPALTPEGVRGLGEPDWEQGILWGAKEGDDVWGRGTSGGPQCLGKRLH